MTMWIKQLLPKKRNGKQLKKLLQHMHWPSIGPHLFSLDFKRCSASREELEEYLKVNNWQEYQGEGAETPQTAYEVGEQVEPNEWQREFWDQFPRYWLAEDIPNPFTAQAIKNCARRELAERSATDIRTSSAHGSGRRTARTPGEEQMQDPEL
eukprot:s47_g47.t1